MKSFTTKLLIPVIFLVSVNISAELSAMEKAKMCVNTAHSAAGRVCRGIYSGIDTVLTVPGNFVGAMKAKLPRCFTIEHAVVAATASRALMRTPEFLTQCTQTMLDSGFSSMNGVYTVGTLSLEQSKAVLMAFPDLAQWVMGYLSAMPEWTVYLTGSVQVYLAAAIVWYAAKVAYAHYRLATEKKVEQLVVEKDAVDEEEQIIEVFFKGQQELLEDYIKGQRQLIVNYIKGQIQLNEQSQQ